MPRLAALRCLAPEEEVVGSIASGIPMGGGMQKDSFIVRAYSFCFRVASKTFASLAMHTRNKTATMLY